MKIIELTVGPVQTNCYILAKEEGSSCVVVDPGEEAEKIADQITKNGWKCEAILLTHGHFDHITGTGRLCELTGAKVYANEAERDLLSDPVLNCSGMAGHAVAIEPEYFLRDGQKIEIAGITFQMIATPGHTSGGCCYYVEEEQILFSGDTVFMESVGRTDLPTGNMQRLIDSVRERIFILPDAVKIYPGHGPETSVGYEKQNNPYA